MTLLLLLYELNRANSVYRGSIRYSLVGHIIFRTCVEARLSPYVISWYLDEFIVYMYIASYQHWLLAISKSSFFEIPKPN